MNFVYRFGSCNCPILRLSSLSPLGSCCKSGCKRNLTAVDELVGGPQDIAHRLVQDLEGGMLHFGRKVAVEENQHRVDDVEATVDQEAAAPLPEARLHILRE